MWSHYGRNHTGICIEFDIPALITHFSQIGTANETLAGLFLAIKYDTIRENYNFGQGENEDRYSLLMWLKTKSQDWGYENEIRYVLTNWSGASMTLPAHAVRAVRLGSRITPDNEKQVRAICRAQYTNAKDLKMKISTTEFKLEESAS